MKLARKALYVAISDSPILQHVLTENTRYESAHDMIKTDRMIKQ